MGEFSGLNAYGIVIMSTFKSSSKTFNLMERGFYGKRLSLHARVGLESREG